MAAAESLRGKRGLANDLVAPSDPEAVSGAKEWLSARMPSPMKYREVIDQPALTSQFDFPSARRADSFEKCFRAVTHLLQAVCKMNGDNQG